MQGKTIEKGQKISQRFIDTTIERVSHPAFVSIASVVIGALTATFKNGPLILKMLFFFIGVLATWLLYCAAVVFAMIQSSFINYAGQKSDLEEM